MSCIRRIIGEDIERQDVIKMRYREVYISIEAGLR